MRIGELCALKWKGHRFKKQRNNIFIKLIIIPTNNTVKYTLLTPKTKGSKRKGVTIDDDLN